MHGSAYPSHFENARRNQVMKRFVTSKVISRINDNASCLPCFLKKIWNFPCLINILFFKIAHKLCRQIKSTSQTAAKLSAIGLGSSFQSYSSFICLFLAPTPTTMFSWPWKLIFFQQQFPSYMFLRDTLLKLFLPLENKPECIFIPW